MLVNGYISWSRRRSSTEVPAGAEIGFEAGPWRAVDARDQDTVIVKDAHRASLGGGVPFRTAYAAEDPPARTALYHGLKAASAG
jgi:hypothetical protein